jgi:hypothetical protein
MSTRAYNTHTESTTQPPSGKLGDEWYNPITGTLYKYIAVNGTNVQWTSSVFSSGAVSIAITNEIASGTSFYPTLSGTASGALSGVTISNTKLYFTPSTGTLNATIFNSLSDETKKTSIVSITDALNKVKQLSGVTYNFIDSSEPSAGLIAQQVEKVLPQAVKYNPEQQAFTLNYNGVTGLLVEAIKILSDEKDQLANTVNALSERIAELEKNAKLF